MISIYLVVAKGDLIQTEIEIFHKKYIHFKVPNINFQLKFAHILYSKNYFFRFTLIYILALCSRFKDKYNIKNYYIDAIVWSYQFALSKLKIIFGL